LLLLLFICLFVVHLIIDPGRDSGSLALLMKRVSGRQTRYVNKLEKRFRITEYFSQQPLPDILA
jgi:hypothetical protein